MSHSKRNFSWVLTWNTAIGIALSAPVYAGLGPNVSFPEIWKIVRARAPNMRAASEELEAARIHETRMSRHWYPRVFAEGRAFFTNDPALTFMSLLGQRQIGVADFSPTVLHQPGSGLFEHASLGLDFPLFEGGAKVAMAQSSEKVTESKSFEKTAAELSQYGELANAYSSLLSLSQQQDELQKLLRGVNETISHYKIGTKSNPVGYSGLLGLKNLRNRLQGLLAESLSKSGMIHSQIQAVAKDLPVNWEPKRESAREFITANLAQLMSKSSGAADVSVPASVRAARSGADALEAAKSIEKAKYLPKIGLFGSGDLYGGARGVGTEYTTGAYVQWELFSASNLAAVNEAEHTAAAAQARSDALSDRAEVERAGASLTVAALEKNLELLGESTKFLEEQTETARGLFRNGSLNALQLVEVLARRADLLVSRTEAEQMLAQARVTLFVHSGAPLSDGVNHEN